MAAFFLFLEKFMTPSPTGVRFLHSRFAEDFISIALDLFTNGAYNRGKHGERSVPLWQPKET